MPLRKKTGTKTMQIQSVETRSRHGDLMGTVQNGTRHGLAHAEIAMDIFDLHRRVIRRMPTAVAPGRRAS